MEALGRDPGDDTDPVVVAMIGLLGPLVGRVFALQARVEALEASVGQEARTASGLSGSAATEVVEVVGGQRRPGPPGELRRRIGAGVPRHLGELRPETCKQHRP